MALITKATNAHPRFPTTREAPPMPYTASDLLTAELETCQRVVDTQLDAILDASRLICDTLSAGGRWWVFGTGHSHMIAEEFYGRAGGLTDIHPILEPALMLHESLAKSTLLERRAGLADDLLEVHGPTRGDVIVIASNSGRNAVPVEMAEGARQRGVAVIAITSMAHSRSVTSRAPSGKRLFELADVVIDNCGTPGDAAVDGEQGGVGATSTLTGALIAQAITVEVVGQMRTRGTPVDTYTSFNI
ncbi:Uncharacterized protein containing SIS (Sugar ISomerase) phosphosugar binding domain [Acidipropionibacterium jensenii]|uniref:Uncharacterized protein containing SIS (Sugar ISomerase) phosphosugar binding domain n=2 Tax=Acidipropionibacterium jensenii TaxID=1749 RepID=A0A448P0K1_9ACTN|nr:Uncharacterized protein containing SIS (Sugar ISomerase) phosphosugar binding domain [Acidipropionibacterium jensenii]